MIVTFWGAPFLYFFGHSDWIVGPDRRVAKGQQELVPRVGQRQEAAGIVDFVNGVRAAEGSYIEEV